MMRRTRMEAWLWLATFANGRALRCAGKLDDLNTVRNIRDSLAPWVTR